MANERPIRRMTLRQLLTQSEKVSRDLADLVHTQFLARITDFRDLSRPVRRRSHYPSLVALQNSLRKVAEASDQLQILSNYLNEHLDAIREHASRERVNRG